MPLHIELAITRLLSSIEKISSTIHDFDTVITPSDVKKAFKRCHSFPPVCDPSDHTSEWGPTLIDLHCSCHENCRPLDDIFCWRSNDFCSRKTPPSDRSKLVIDMTQLQGPARSHLERLRSLLLRLLPFTQTTVKPDQSIFHLTSGLFALIHLVLDAASDDRLSLTPVGHLACQSLKALTNWLIQQRGITLCIQYNTMVNDLMMEAVQLLTLTPEWDTVQLIPRCMLRVAFLFQTTQTIRSDVLIHLWHALLELSHRSSEEYIHELIIFHNFVCSSSSTHLRPLTANNWPVNLCDRVLRLLLSSHPPDFCIEPHLLDVLLSLLCSPSYAGDPPQSQNLHQYLSQFFTNWIHLVETDSSDHPINMLSVFVSALKTIANDRILATISEPLLSLLILPLCNQWPSHRFSNKQQQCTFLLAVFILFEIVPASSVPLVVECLTCLSQHRNHFGLGLALRRSPDVTMATLSRIHELLVKSFAVSPNVHIGSKVQFWRSLVDFFLSIGCSNIKFTGTPPVGIVQFFWDKLADLILQIYPVSRNEGCVPPIRFVSSYLLKKLNTNIPDLDQSLSLVAFHQVLFLLQGSIPSPLDNPVPYSPLYTLLLVLMESQSSVKPDLSRNTQILEAFSHELQFQLSSYPCERSDLFVPLLEMMDQTVSHKGILTRASMRIQLLLLHALIRNLSIVDRHSVRTLVLLDRLTKSIEHLADTSVVYEHSSFLDDLLFALETCKTCTTVFPRLVSLLRSILVKENRLVSPDYQLSVSQFGRLWNVILAEVRHSSTTPPVCTCSSEHIPSVASDLLSILIDWSNAFDPLTPSSFCSWPVYNESDGFLGSDTVLQNNHFARARPTALAAPDGRPLRSLFGPHGLVISTWLSFPNLNVDINMSSDETDLIHLFSLETIHGGRNSDLLSSFRELSFQLWFSPSRSELLVKVYQTYALGGRRDSPVNSEEERRQPTTQAEERTGYAWFPVPNSGQLVRSWNHLFIKLWEVDEYTVGIDLVFSAHRVHLTRINLETVTTTTSIPDRSQTLANCLQFDIGQRSVMPTTGPQVDMGDVHVFALQETDSAVSTDLALWLTFLGPDWSGTFDFLDCGSTYHNQAECLLQWLVRRLCSQGAHAEACELLLNGSQMLSSVDWFRSVKRCVQTSLISSTNLSCSLLYIRKPILITESCGGSTGGNGGFELREPGSQVTSILSAVSFCLPTICPNPDTATHMVPVTFPVTYTGALNHALEPHGGIDLILCLLGEVVCTSKARDSVAMNARLQSLCLELLFAFLNHSLSMTVKFRAFALSEFGVGKSRATSGRQQAIPLSYGGCALSRLFKHPQFLASSVDIFNILFRQLFASSTQDRARISDADYLLVDPELLRCLLLFGPGSLWLPPLDNLSVAQYGSTGFLPAIFNVFSIALRRRPDVVVTTYLLDAWQLIPIALAAYREHFLSDNLGDSAVTSVRLTPNSPVLDNFFQFLTARILSTDINQDSTRDYTNRLHSILCRQVICLDADLYLRATEQVFFNRTDPNELDQVTSDAVQRMWLWWHIQSVGTVHPERRDAWISPLRVVQLALSIPKDSAASSIRGRHSQSVPQQLFSSPASPDPAYPSNLVDWSELSDAQASVTELEAIARYSVKVLGYTIPVLRPIRTQSFSEEDGSSTTGGGRWSFDEIGTELQEDMRLEDWDSSSPPASPDKTQLPGDRTQQFVKQLVLCLQSVWLEKLAERVKKEDIPDAVPTANFRPPLWLIHSLLGHPCVSMREAGISGYRLWLLHSMTSYPTRSSVRHVAPPITHNPLAASLMHWSAPLHLSDPQQQRQSAYQNRHLCSAGLLNQALEFALDGLLSVDPVELVLPTEHTDQNPENYCTLQKLSASTANRVMLSRISDVHRCHWSHSFPVVMCAVVSSISDAVLCDYSVTMQQPRLGSSSQPPEIRLAVSAIKAFTNLLEICPEATVPLAVNLGLIPCLYSMAWLLESGLCDFRQKLKDGHGATNRMLFTPILPALCRLIGRVTGWLLSDEVFHSCDDTFNSDMRFNLVVSIFRQLLVLSPVRSDRPKLSKTNRSTENPVQYNPGPISRCLTRRVLLTAIDRLLRHLETVVQESPTGDNAMRQTLNRLNLVVDNTVDVFLHTANLVNPLVQFVQPLPSHLHRPGTADLSETTRSSSNLLSPPITSSSLRRSHSLCNLPVHYSSAFLANAQDAIDPYRSFQHNLDHAILTLLFSTIVNMQNGTFSTSSNVKSVVSVLSDCLQALSKAIGRILVARTHPATLEVALDPVISYLIKIGNEESGSLLACLGSLPPMYAMVFWTNLVELEEFLQGELVEHSPLLSSCVTLQRSSSLNKVHVEPSTIAVWGQLKQLMEIIQDLSGNYRGSHEHQRITASKHRSLLQMAQSKSLENWIKSLPPYLGDCVSGFAYPSFTGVPSKTRLYTLMGFLSLASTTNEAEADGQQTMQRRAERIFSAIRLHRQSHRRCVEGNSAWRQAYSERMRIAGPISTVLWTRIADSLYHPCALLYDAASTPLVKFMDPTEGPMRQRRRLFPAHLPLASRLVEPDKQDALAENRGAHPLAKLIGLPEVICPPEELHACIWKELPLYLPVPSTPLIHLASASRHGALGVWACRLVGPLYIPPVEGDLILGQSWLRFQPDTSRLGTVLSTYDSLFQINPVDRLWLAWPLVSINRIEERRFALRNLAVEIFPDRAVMNTPSLFALRSTKERDCFMQTLREHLNSFSLQPSSSSQQTTSSRLDNKSTVPIRARRRALRLAQQSWLNRQLSNFAYLTELNSLADRTYNDLMQYPIFPWVLQDYTSSVLDLGHPRSYRRLDRPIAVQYDDRAESVAQYYKNAEEYSRNRLMELTETNNAPTDSNEIPANLAGLVCPPYHYPSHCSNETIVLHFLVRLLPYALRHIQFQDNHFDVPDRLFHSVATTWMLTTSSVTCVKELIPEFYFAPELFTNEAGLALGNLQRGDSVAHVELPPWSKGSARLFTLVCRAALESDYVTNKLADWIDLVFGYKQCGKLAKEALNLYHPYTYFGAVDVEKIDDPIRAQAVEAMISSYGQTPKQLFRKGPHPSRFGYVASLHSAASRLILHTQTGDWILTDTTTTSSLDSNTSDSSSDSDLDQISTYHYPTPSIHSELTPLETVIGLRWGTWAGSPHAAPLRVLHRSRLTDALQTDIRLSTALWYMGCECSSVEQQQQVRRTYQYLNDSWSGWVVPPVSLSATTSYNCIRNDCLGPVDLTDWCWSVLGSESNAVVWVGRETGKDDIPVLIKCTVNPDGRTLSIHVRTLDVNGALRQEGFLSVTPDCHYDACITAMAISGVALEWIQLLVGFSNGSIYSRRLPRDLQLFTTEGWLPSGFKDPTPASPAAPSANTQLKSPNSDVSPMIGDFLPSVSLQDMAGLWEVTGWRQVFGHAGHSITSIAVCPHFSLIATGDDEGRACLWDIHRFALVAVLDGPERSPSGLIDQNSSLQRDDDMSTSCSPGQRINLNNSQGYGQIDALCFCATSGELAVAYWNKTDYHTFWVGVYSASGSRVASRVVNFMAEITDGQGKQYCSSRPALPMAYSTIPEGQGVNCLVLGGPGGRLIWLNSWTLDTVHTMLVSQTNITSLTFIPSTPGFHSPFSHPFPELLCQGLCVIDQDGWVYCLGPHARQTSSRSSASSRSHHLRQTASDVAEEGTEKFETNLRGLWIGM